MIQLAISADDRTGALETAGMCADAGLAPAIAGSTVALSGLTAQQLDRYCVVVVDLGSRHRSPPEAGRMAVAGSLAIRAHRYAHKVDSTLRGNWASELTARYVQSGRRVLLVPAFPDAGRTCIGGTVLEHGIPVAEGHAGNDPLAPIRSSRPSDYLFSAGAPAIRSCADAFAVRDWLASGREAFAICDARSHADLDEIGRAWAAAAAAVPATGIEGVLFAGTAAAIASAAKALSAGTLAPEHPPAAPGPTRPDDRLSARGPVLVVCGSLHPLARQQIAALTDRGATGAVIHLDSTDNADANTADTTDIPTLAQVLSRADGVVVLRSPDQAAPTPTDGVPRAPLAVLDTSSSSRGENRALPSGEAHAVELGRIGRALAEAHELGILVIIGGDTAAAIIGDRTVVVNGTVATGVPIGSLLRNPEVTVVTKAGGFGDTLTLARLIYGR